jgi:hypothetical protein
MTTISHVNISTIEVPQKKFTRLREVTSSYKPPWYLVVVKKISALVSNFFNFLCFWKWWSDDSLTKDQSKALEGIKNKEIAKVKSHYQKRRQLRFERSQQVAVSDDSPVQLEEPKKTVKSIYAEREFNPSLNVLREFIGEFVENSIDCLYEEKIAPVMNRRGEISDKVEFVLKKLSPFVVHLGNQVKVDIFEGLINEQFAKPETFNAPFSESLHRGLHWLLERDEVADAETFLNETLRIDLEKRLVEKNIDAHPNTIERVVQWVKIHADKKLHHVEQSETPDLEKEITHTVSQECISFLFETKIEILYRNVKEKIVDKLDVITSNFLTTNGRKVADEVSGRLSEILSEVKFNTVIDKVVDLTYTHVKNYISAKEKIQKHIKDAKITHDNNEQVDQFIHDNIPVFYSTLPKVHPYVQDIYLGANDNVDTRKWKKAIETRGIKEFVRDTYEIICSQVTVEIDGQPKSVDWLEYLFEQIELPVEVTEIFDEIKDFIKQVLPDEDLDMTENIEKLCYDISKELVIAITRSQIKKVISQLLYQFYKQLMSPEKISSMFSDQLLPLILEQTIVTHVENIVLHQKSALIPLLTKLRKKENEEETLQALYKKIWELTQKQTNQFDFESEGITEEKFKNEYATKLVENIHQALQSEKLKGLSISKIIDNLLATKSGHADPRYSEMILDMVFKIGEFGGGFTQGVASLFTGELNTVIGGTVKSLSENNFHLIDVTVTKLERKLGDKESLRKIYFGKKEDKHSASEQEVQDAVHEGSSSDKTNDSEESTVQVRLQGEIAKLSKVIHDISMENINNQTQGWLWSLVPTTRVAKSVLGNDSTHLQNMMIKMFNKILFNEPMNCDFYFKVQDIMLATIQEADKAVKVTNRQLNNKLVEIVA